MSLPRRRIERQEHAPPLPPDLSHRHLVPRSGGRPFERAVALRPSRHAAVTAPIPILRSDAGYGDKDFYMNWKCAEKPYVDEQDTHRHDFDQYLVFLGGDPRNMLDLGGEVELTLSEDGVNLETHTFTKFTTVYIKAGLYHCPLVFKKVTKPIIFYYYVSRLKYDRIQTK